MSKKSNEIWAILHSVSEVQRELTVKQKELTEQQKVTDERLAKKSEEFAEQMRELTIKQKELAEQQRITDERLARKSEEFAEQQKELTEQQKELTEQQKELTEQQKELAEQQKVTDERLAKRSEEFLEQQKELAERHKATDTLLKHLAKQIGGMSNNDGAVAEEFFWNALKNKKEINGIAIEYSDKNVYRKKGSIQDEFDIVLWNGNSVVVVETKYKVHSDAIKNLKEKKIPNFKRLFSDKSERKLYIAIAGFSIPDEVAKEAKENGFFIFRQSGENLLIESDELKVY